MDNKMCCELCGCCCRDDLPAEERETTECIGGYTPEDDPDETETD